jgi:spore maturation protein CgeB
LKEEGYNVVFSKNMPYDEYLKTISRSFIAVSAWGAGESSMRMWQIMANKTCCFRQKTQIEFPNAPLDGEHCVTYKTAEEFEEKIRDYLKRKDDCIKIGIKGFEHTKKFHVGKAKVQYMLDKMKI